MLAPGKFICPAVNGVAGNFFKNRPCPFWGVKRIIPEVPDQERIYSADEDTSVGKLCSNRFVVSTGVLHAALRLSVGALDLLDQCIDCGLGVWDIAGRHQDHIAGPADCDSALTFGNINTNSVRKKNSFTM